MKNPDAPGVVRQLGVFTHHNRFVYILLHKNMSHHKLELETLVLSMPTFPDTYRMPYHCVGTVAIPDSKSGARAAYGFALAWKLAQLRSSPEITVICFVPHTRRCCWDIPQAP
ncbi:e2.1 [Ichnoviriform fugitivi]|uniref:E2.1 n=1 Tax=Ichnoviriform fugitivi TaxID=265522 RepID=A2Q0P1_9VIRU|nr:e2.1 [Ichnoviriform fugitivi]BAF45756.1 e2.1 [Ichnoviriform fugitivi]